MILYKFVSYFSKPYCIFYTFLNFIWFSGNVKEIENSKTGAHSAGPALAHGPDTVGSAHEPSRPAGKLNRRGATCSRGHHAQRTGWRAFRRPDDKVLPVSTMGSPGWHRARWYGEVLTVEAGRWRGGGVEATVQWRFTAVGEFRCSMTRATGSCSTRGPWGMRGGQRRRVMMAGVGAHWRGQSEATSAALRRLMVDRRARGEWGWRSCLAWEGEREGKKAAMVRRPIKMARQRWGRMRQFQSAGSNNVQINLNWFKWFQNCSNFDWSKKYLPR
jgi:hypothetical protein